MCLYSSADKGTICTVQLNYLNLGWIHRSGAGDHVGGRPFHLLIVSGMKDFWKVTVLAKALVGVGIFANVDGRDQAGLRNVSFESSQFHI